MSQSDNEPRMIRFHPLTPTFGAELFNPDLSSPTETDLVALSEALDQFGLLVARQQVLNEPNMIRLSQAFGALDSSTLIEVSQSPFKSSQDVAVLPTVDIASAGDASFNLHDPCAPVWSADFSHQSTPPSATMLYLIEGETVGGDTEFASMTAAFRALPDDLAQHAKSLSIKHAAPIDRSEDSARYDPISHPGSVHPAVIRHPRTDEPSLYLGSRRNAYVVGQNPDESEGLLDAFWRYATLDDHCYRHLWRPGDLVIWDSWTTMRRWESVGATSLRVFHRTQIRSLVKLDDCWCR